MSTFLINLCHYCLLVNFSFQKNDLFILCQHYLFAFDHLKQWTRLIEQMPMVQSLEAHLSPLSTNRYYYNSIKQDLLFHWNISRILFCVIRCSHAVLSIIDIRGCVLGIYMLLFTFLSLICKFKKFWMIERKWSFRFFIESFKQAVEKPKLSKTLKL